MARHPQTREQAELKGATAKDPQRYQGKPARNKNPLPDPPKHLAGAQKKIWLEIASNGLPGTLTESDWLIVEQAVELVHEFRDVSKHNKAVPRLKRKWEKELASLQEARELAETKTEKTEIGRTIRKHMKLMPQYRVFPTARIQALRGILATMGLTPSDRQRLHLPDGDGSGEEEDDFEPINNVH